MGAQRKPVHLLAAHVPSAGDLLGALSLMDEVEPAVDGRAVGLAGAVLGGGPDRNPAHGLDSAGDHDVHGPRRDCLGAEMDGLLGRAALSVDGGAWHGVREPGGQGCVAADVHGLLPHRHGAPEDDVFDHRRVEIVASQERQ